MSQIICPNCGNQQEGGDRCARCNSLFAYYGDQSNPESGWRPAESVVQTTRPGRTEVKDVVRDPSVFDKARKYYRVAQWVTLGVIVFVVVLILRKGTPPPVMHRSLRRRARGGEDSRFAGRAVHGDATQAGAR